MGTLHCPEMKMAKTLKENALKMLEPQQLGPLLVKTKKKRKDDDDDDEIVEQRPKTIATVLTV